MKTISTALTNYLLDNTVTNRADLISIILPNSQVMNVLFGTNYTFITYPTLPATYSIPGFGYPWSPTDPTYPFTPSGAGVGAGIAMSQGQIIILQWNGTTYCSLHFGVLPTNPNGGPQATGGFTEPSFFNAAAPARYISPVVAPPGSLIGGFANAAGNLVAPPFLVGANAIVGPAPVGTAKLYLGISDNYYADNSGEWVMNIVPTTYYCTQYGAWERGPFSNKADFKISAESMKLTGFVPESVSYPGTQTPLMQAINQGALTGSQVVIQTLFWPLGSPPSSGFSMGTMQLTQGQIGNVKNTGRSVIECEVFDLTYILNRPFPPHMIQSSCRHTFCDAGCTLIISNYQSTAIALESTSTTLYLDFNIGSWVTGTSYQYGNLIVYNNVIFMCTNANTSSGSFDPTSTQQERGGVFTDGGGVQWTSMGSYAPGTSPTSASGAGTQSFPLGYVIGVTGQNTGFKRTIKAQTTSATGSYPEIQLLWPLPFPVASGDTFILVAGCDKTLSTCENIYNNLIHIGAMPFVPSPEIA